MSYFVLWESFLIFFVNQKKKKKCRERGGERELSYKQLVRLPIGAECGVISWEEGQGSNKAILPKWYPQPSSQGFSQSRRDGEPVMICDLLLSSHKDCGCGPRPRSQQCAQPVFRLLLGLANGKMRHAAAALTPTPVSVSS